MNYICNSSIVTDLEKYDKSIDDMNYYDSNNK